jgi:hypothetical protein
MWRDKVLIWQMTKKSEVNTKHCRGYQRTKLASVKSSDDSTESSGASRHAVDIAKSSNF